MAEYINRETVLEIVNKFDDRTALVFGRKIVNLAPADVTPVVRCRNCKHSREPSLLTQTYGEPGTLTCTYGPTNRRNVRADFFCCNGELKAAPTDSGREEKGHG